MQSLTALIGRAVNEAASAVARAPRSESLAGDHIAQATSFATQASGAMTPSSISTADAAVAQRGVGVLDIATKALLKSDSALIRAAASPLGKAVSSIKKALGAADNTPSVVETALNRKQRKGLPSGFQKAAGGSAHLLILNADGGESFYFNLSTAAYSELRRVSDYSVASQERLTRRPALQAVARGGETITLPGVIWTAGKPGAGQLNALRAIGFAQEPVTLTTGYGEVLGRWYLTKVAEEQGGLMSDGAPRKQTFTLEFGRYGDDFTNI